VIQNDPQQSTDRRPPVFSGQSRPTPGQPTAVKPADDGDEVIKVETNLVTMPVSVLDREGRFVTGLTQKDFRIFENGIEQKVDYFQSVEQPFTVILMIDVSPSTAYQIDEIHDAAISFIDQLRPNDRVMVMSFDDRVHVLTEPTNNRNQLRNAILESQFGDGTSLYEAVDFAVNQELKRIEGRKAVVIFTDGVDTTSRRANYQSTISDVEEADALFYPVRYDTQQRGFGGGGGGGGYGYPRRRRGGGGGLGDIIGIVLGGGQINMGGGPAGSSPEEYATGKRYLEQLAQNSGGREFEAAGNLDAAFSGIAEELRRQYSLGYYPDAVGQKGERKQIKVRVMRPNLVVRAKSSYIVGENGGRVAGK
jgi:VWFA-related protein